ncbi:MAG: Rieske (2Fe-2S) protein [Nocardioidaceae bacterium]|nr:Rieske (2Fe-2S) protein [Nocardioidaceae bacterium]
MGARDDAGGVPRRAVVALGGAGVALPLIAACGGGGGTTNGAAGSTAKTTPPAPSPTARGGKAPAQPPLTSTSDVPVGGAVVLPAQSLVVTQPKAGEFRCFSSTCTHAGCPVQAGPTLDCPCHGSEFSITDGSVLQGPASAPLPAKTIKVASGQIYLES